MWLVIVVAALVFEPRPIAMFLSLSIGCHYKPYYETHEFLLSSVLFYYAVFLVVILMVMLLIVRVMMLIHSYRVR
jgi:flagellar biosynthesis protein FliR